MIAKVSGSLKMALDDDETAFYDPYGQWRSQGRFFGRGGGSFVLILDTNYFITGGPPPLPPGYATAYGVCILAD